MFCRWSRNCSYIIYKELHRQSVAMLQFFFRFLMPPEVLTLRKDCSGQKCSVKISTPTHSILISGAQQPNSKFEERS